MDVKACCIFWAVESFSPIVRQLEIQAQLNAV